MFISHRYVHIVEHSHIFSEPFTVTEHSHIFSELCTVTESHTGCFIQHLFDQRHPIDMITHPDTDIEETDHDKHDGDERF